MTEYRLTTIDRVEWVLFRGPLFEDMGTESLGSGTDSCSSESTGESEGWLFESVISG